MDKSTDFSVTGDTREALGDQRKACPAGSGEAVCVCVCVCVCVYDVDLRRKESDQGLEARLGSEGKLRNNHCY